MRASLKYHRQYRNLRPYLGRSPQVHLALKRRNRVPVSRVSQRAREAAQSGHDFRPKADVASPGYGIALGVYGIVQHEP